jgi:hypothetical protein
VSALPAIAISNHRKSLPPVLSPCNQQTDEMELNPINVHPV